MSYVNALIRLPGSGYTAQLRGVAGTNTSAITLQGNYSSSWDAHVFQMQISGLYELWVDPAGGSTYSKDARWSGGFGKLKLGWDFAQSVQP